MTKRRSRQSGRDDVARTIAALGARIREAGKKLEAASQAAPRREGLIPLIAARAKAIDEYMQSFASVRREAEANLAEAHASGDLRGCVEFKRFLLKFEKEEQRMEEQRRKNMEEQRKRMEEPPNGA